MMKKIILIGALFFSLSAIGQSYTYIAQRYEWLAGLFKALGLPAGDSAQFQAGQRQRAGSVYFDSTGADAGLYVYDGADWQLASSGVPYLNSTGLLANGLLTINGGDPAKFDLAAGSGEILDYATDPVNPTKTSVSWSAFTAQTVTNIASADKTYVMINSAGAITQQTTFPTQQERRQKIFVGTIVHPNHSTIQNARTVPDFVQGPASQMYDFFDALGAFSVDGNRISPNGVNLSFNKTAGHIFRRGANYQGDDQNPHVATLAAGTPQSFIKSTVNAQVGGTVTVVDPANYDVGGTVTAIPGGVNNSTIQRVYAFSSGLVFVQYGQTVYASLAAAVEGIKNEAFTINPSIADGGVLLAYIVLTKGCTDLSNSAQAVILPAPRFDAGVGGGSTAVTNLQQAYNNSVTPQITTTTSLGSVDIKRGSAADGDNVFRVMNGSGTATTSIAGNGAIVATLPTSAGNKAVRYNTSTGAITYADTTTHGNLLFDSLGTSGISPVTVRNNTLMSRRIDISGGDIDTTASGGLLITVPGIVSLNTLTGAMQTFATGTTGTDFNISSSGTTHTFNIPSASASNRGLITIGGQTIAGNKTFSGVTEVTGGLTTTSSGFAGNLFLVGGTGGTNTTQAEYNVLGGAGTALRVGLRGSSAASITTNHNYAPIVIGQMSSTEASTGTSPINAGIIIRQQVVANAAGSTDYLVGAYIEGPPTGVTPNIAQYGFWVDKSSARFDSIFNSNGTNLTANQIWGANSSATAMEGKTLTNGQNFNITHGAGTITLAGATLTKNINLRNPTASENEFIFFTPVAITVTNTRAVLVGSSTPSVTYNIAFGTDRTSLTNVYTSGQTVTSTTTGTDAAGVNDNTIPANSWVVLTTSAQSGTVTAINTSIQFTED